MKRIRSGFTLIEVLTVIGIILILLGLLVVGFRHVNYMAAKKETVAELHVCRGMLTEYENHNGDSFITTVYSLATFKALLVSSSINNQLLVVSGSLESQLSSSSLRYGAPGNPAGAVAATQTLMQYLMQVPSNRTLVQSLQTKRLLEPFPGTVAQSYDQVGPVLLDGWGNPILLIPATGLTVGITTYSSTGTTTTAYFVVRTSGTYSVPNNITAGPTITAADRPFFASAGQDGDFSKGEDNVYSFQD